MKDNLTTNASDEAASPAFLVGAVSCRIINGCFDCPFNYEYDMAVGYGCRLDTENRSIRQSKKYQPIAPDWCPVKNGSVVVKYNTLAQSGKPILSKQVIKEEIVVNGEGTNLNDKAAMLKRARK